MEQQQVIFLILLLLVILDAAGDAFRLRKWQIAHHVMESIHVAVWIAVWALFEFQPYYIAMYILGRFMLFDIIFNLIAGLKWSYIGESSLYGRFLKWFVLKVKEPGHLVMVLRVMAMAWWIAWFITK